VKINISLIDNWTGKFFIYSWENEWEMVFYWNKRKCVMQKNKRSLYRYEKTNLNYNWGFTVIIFRCILAPALYFLPTTSETHQNDYYTIDEKN